MFYIDQNHLVKHTVETSLDFYIYFNRSLFEYNRSMPNDEKPVDKVEAKKALFKHIYGAATLSAEKAREYLDALVLSHPAIVSFLERQEKWRHAHVPKYTQDYLNNVVKFHRIESDKNREYERSEDRYVNVFQREPHELVLHLTQAGYNFPDCVTTFKGAECVGWSIYRPPITRMREPFHLKFEDQYVEAPLKVVIEFEVPAKFNVSPTGWFTSYRPDPQNMSEVLFKKEHNPTPYNKPDRGLRFYSADYRESELRIAAEMERTLDVDALKTYLEIHEPEMLNEEAQRQARQYFLRNAVNKVEPQAAENFQELLNEEIEKQHAQGEVKSTSVDGGLTWTLDEGGPITKVEDEMRKNNEDSK